MMTLTEKVEKLAQNVKYDKVATEALYLVTHATVPIQRSKRGPGYGVIAACREYSGILRGSLARTYYLPRKDCHQVIKANLLLEECWQNVKKAIDAWKRTLKDGE